MANIRIISGTYGFRENGMIHPKDAHSGVFEVDDKEAERLVALNVAAYAAEQPLSSKAGVYPPADEIADSEPVSASDGDSNENGDYEYDETTPVSKLREIGKALGLSFPVGTTKATMRDEIDSALNNGPDIGAEEPVME